MAAVPSGFRFLPTDKELLSYFLFKKLSDSLSPFESSLIPYRDLYSNQHLSEIFQNLIPNSTYALDESYFFTKLKKNKSRIQRCVGENGGRHGEDAGIKIAVEVGSKSTEGFKKRFSYREKGRKEKSGWIMTDYSLPEFNSEFVVCRLKKAKTGNKSACNPPTKKRKREDDENPEAMVSPSQRDSELEFENKVTELEKKAQTLETETTNLSSKLILLQRDSAELTFENNELTNRLKAMEQEALLQDALTEALTAEVQRSKIAFTSQVNQFNYIHGLDDLCEL